MKKLTILFLFISHVSFAQYAWYQKANNFGGGNRYSAAAVSINNKGYVFCGNSLVTPFLFNDTWEYTPTTDTWVQKTSFPGVARGIEVAFAINNIAYVGTGNNGSGGTIDFYSYNPATDVWDTLANFPGGAREQAVGFSIGGKGYFGCGQTTGGTVMNDFWEYNPTTDIWTAKANYPGNPVRFATGFSINTKGYVGAGRNGNTYYNDFYEYDPTLNMWTQKANLPAAKRNGSSAFSIGNYGYFGLGSDSSKTCLTDWFEYNPTTNTWATAATFSGISRTVAFSFSIGNSGYVGGGACSATTSISYNDVWEYSPFKTGINNSPNQTSVEIYPNPFSTQFQLNYSLAALKNASVIVSDLSGRTIISSPINSLTRQQTINLSGCANGIYLLSVINNGKEIFHFKLVKME